MSKKRRISELAADEPPVQIENLKKVKFNVSFMIEDAFRFLKSAKAKEFTPSVSISCPDLLAKD